MIHRNQNDDVMADDNDVPLIQCYRGRAEQSAAPVHLCFSRKKYMINKLFNRQSTKLSVCCLFLKQDVSA